MTDPFLPTEALIDAWMDDWAPRRTEIDPVTYVARRAALWGMEQQMQRVKERLVDEAD